MATNRKRTPRSRRESALTPDELNWLYDRSTHPDGDGWFYFGGEEGKWNLWEAYREEVLAYWVSENPCTRPRRWWQNDAPKEPCAGRGAYHKAAQRQRIGGIGTPKFEVLNYGPSFDLGIPDCWVKSWEVAYYNGRSRDINGNPIGQNYKEGDFDGLAVDPLDPPRFESQAAYLQRHSLLTTEEVKYLKRHPELLEPETVTLTC